MTPPTPREGCRGQRGGDVRVPGGQGRTTQSPAPEPRTQPSEGPTHLVPDEHGPHVEAGACTIGHPVLVHLDEPADALQQLHLVKALRRNPGASGGPAGLPPLLTLGAPLPTFPCPLPVSPPVPEPLTGRQRRPAERSMRSMLSHGRKRRTCWSLPLKAFRPSKSCGTGSREGAQPWGWRRPGDTEQDPHTDATGGSGWALGSWSRTPLLSPTIEGFRNPPLLSPPALGTALQPSAKAVLYSTSMWTLVQGPAV